MQNSWAELVGDLVILAVSASSEEEERSGESRVLACLQVSGVAASVASS